ncbi:hypothetical protein MHBO_003065 [Bonamia ostreae]|uniref:Uncharacterized protein n=1 Tax=Bonamia ostreae TaxID=126728 RepID=A0ABV2APD1_9EUKA
MLKIRQIGSVCKRKNRLFLFVNFRLFAIRKKELRILRRKSKREEKSVSREPYSIVKDRYSQKKVKFDVFYYVLSYSSLFIALAILIFMARYYYRKHRTHSIINEARLTINQTKNHKNKRYFLPRNAQIITKQTKTENDYFLHLLTPIKSGSNGQTAFLSLKINNSEIKFKTTEIQILENNKIFNVLAKK